MRLESLEEKMTLELSKNMTASLDDMLIKGLALKGFTFKAKYELKSFVREHCISLDDQKLQERTYYVNGVPFLLYCYRLDIVEVINNDTVFALRANLGQYTYL